MLNTDDRHSTHHATLCPFCNDGSVSCKPRKSVETRQLADHKFTAEQSCASTAMGLPDDGCLVKLQVDESK